MGVKTEFFTIENVLQQTIIKHLNFDATTTRSKIKLIKMLINTADGIELYFIIIFHLFQIK